MKKVLFASTVLAAGALAAPQFASAQSVSAGNADISFGGYARFGMYYNEDAASEFSITSRYRLQIDASTETDGGLTLGARARIQRNNGFSNTSDVSDAQDGSVTAANGGAGINGVRFFLRAGGLEVGVGNIQGALEFMPGQYPIDLGLTGLGYEYVAYDFGGDAYSSGGDGAANANGVEVIYAIGDFEAHLSTSDTNNRDALVVSYAFGDWTLAAGIQDSDSATDTEITASVGGSFGPADVTLAYADNGTKGDKIVLAGRFDISDSTNIEAYIASEDQNTVNTNAEGESYGIDFNHSLGGGASLRGGIASRFDGGMDADFGVRFNF